MNTEKTLADAQPGGRVRLATVLYDRAHDLLGDAYNAGTHGIGYSQQAMELHDAIIPAQPSPGGQGVDPGRAAVEFIAAANFDVPDGYVVEEHLPGIWHYTYTNAGEKMASCASWNNKAHATIAAWQAALAARQPVGEPVALVVPGAPTRCRHCESTDLEWFAHVRAVNDVPHGRLTTHDVGCVFVLGCNECSETLHTVKADSIAELLAAPPAQAVDLGQFLQPVEFFIAYTFPGTPSHAEALRLLALIDSQAAGNGN